MAERYEPAAVADHGREFRGDEHLAAQGFAQGLDARSFVDRRPDDREVEPVDGTYITVEHLAEMECQVDRGSWLARVAPRGVEPVDGTHRLGGGIERPAADLFPSCVLEREDREHAVAKELQHLATARAK